MMRSVPAHFVDLCIPPLPASQRALALENGIVFGERIEVDLEALSEIDPAVAQQLSNYNEKVQGFWDRYVATGEGGRCAVTVRTLVTKMKVDKKGCKIFLKDQVEALEDLNPMGSAMSKLLGGNFDAEELEAFASKVEIDSNIIIVEFEVEGKHDWAQALGGAPGRGEIGRIFTLKVSHAPSHDRKAQRLLEVKVQAKEIWPM